MWKCAAKKDCNIIGDINLHVSNRLFVWFLAEPGILHNSVLSITLSHIFFHSKDFRVRGCFFTCNLMCYLIPSESVLCSSKSEEDKETDEMFSANISSKLRARTPIYTENHTAHVILYIAYKLLLLFFNFLILLCTALAPMNFRIVLQISLEFKGFFL